jgi:hypothetical protein
MNDKQLHQARYQAWTRMHKDALMPALVYLADNGIGAYFLDTSVAIVLVVDAPSHVNLEEGGQVWIASPEQNAELSGDDSVAWTVQTITDYVDPGVTMDGDLLSVLGNVQRGLEILAAWGTES